MTKLPKLEQPVLVTMPDGSEFAAVRTIVDDELFEPMTVWVTVDEYEPNAPADWTGGICWVVGDDGKPCVEPVSWRKLKGR